MDTEELEHQISLLRKVVADVAQALKNSIDRNLELEVRLAKHSHKVEML